MRKVIGFIFAFVGLAIAFTACSGDTLADKMSSERKAINRFIDSEGIIVTNKFPTDSVFPEKVFYKDPDTGVYIRIISRGTGDRADIAKKPYVYVRFADGRFFGSSDTITYSNIWQGETGNLIRFKYGDTDTYTNTSSSTFAYSFLSPACVLPLQYVSNGGEVSLIVPYASGSTYQNSQYQPLYYGRLRLTY